MTQRITLDEYHNLLGKGQNVEGSSGKRKSKRDNDLALITLIGMLERELGYKFVGKWNKDMVVEDNTIYLEFPFSNARRFRADLAITPERIIVEIHGGSYIVRRSKDGNIQYLGGAHHSPQGRKRDMEKARLANIEDWCYLEFDWADVKDGTAFNDIQDAIKQRRIRNGEDS